MQIVLDHIGRRFNKEWIFRNIGLTFQGNQSYAVLGPNGSGKSTLLQLLSGYLSPSEGKIVYYTAEGKEVDKDVFYQSISLAAPYLDLVEEFSLKELISFHFSFKPFIKGMDAEALTGLLGFDKYAGREIRYFSSGMKQRVKLALAFCSDTPVLLLDEPCTNLDEEGIAWYHLLAERFCGERLTIVGSNQSREYDFCTNRISITDYKL